MMSEETKYTNEFQQENRSEEDNRLPYEPPILRKHGKVNIATKATIPAPDFDGLFGFTDFTDAGGATS